MAGGSSTSLKNGNGGVSGSVELVTSASSNEKFLSSPSSPEAATAETPTTETKVSLCGGPDGEGQGDSHEESLLHKQDEKRGSASSSFVVLDKDNPGETDDEKLKKSKIDEDMMKARQVRIPCNLNRYVLALFFCLVVLLKGCTYWGWNGMQDMLYKSGAYLWVCKEDSTGLGFLHVGDKEYVDCSSRKNMINNLYTTIFATHFISSAISGIVLDTAGPKICMVAAITIEAAGWLLIAFSSQSFSAYYVGGIFLGIAADPGYLPLLSVANLFPGSESFLMAILGSLRSISFAVPVILSAIYQGDAFSPDDFWKVIVLYVGAGLGLSVLISICFVPLRPFKRQSELEQEVATEQATGDKKKNEGEQGEGGDNENLIVGNDKDNSSPVDEGGAGGNKGTFLSSLKSKEFLLIVPCFLIALLRAEFYTKSNKEQLQVVHIENGVETSSNVYQMFSILNILSFLPGPMFGKLTDKYGILLVITILNTCGIFLYIFVMPNVLACKGISTLIYFIYCSFVLSNLYCYVAINFPSEFFGKLTGLASLIGGVFSLTSIGWYKLSSDTLIDMFPDNFLIVDGIMIAFGLINCFIIYQMFREQKRKRQLAVDGGNNKYTHLSSMHKNGEKNDQGESVV
ncbi:major facilitator family protein [Cystoisospora suis]|uniref:Major facilitator family protein n=1 Tax=Cystoisospora suis TaxID=483139 RepID=A0A2C6L365_9APIC|nr:major facilitator family protein [Cystoisospora suis]